MHHIITPESIVYQRPVQYYETDRMQIVHHSNYIRWMEEIRVAFMAQKGVPYTQWHFNACAGCHLLLSYSIPVRGNISGNLQDYRVQRCSACVILRNL